MISRMTFCSASASVMRMARARSMPVTPHSLSGSASMTSNTFSPNALTRPEAADHAGVGVFLDAVDRRELRGVQETRLELPTMGAVVDSFSRRRDLVPGLLHGSVADDRHEIAMAAGLCSQNAEPISALWHSTARRGWRGPPGSTMVRAGSPAGRSRHRQDSGSSCSIQSGQSFDEPLLAFVP